jgi:hypothetical protein
MSPLHPRGNSGYAIPPAAIIFLAILGAAFAVCCGVVILRFHGEDTDEEQVWQKRVPEQDAYMQAVRRRGMRRMGKEGGESLGMRGARGTRRMPASPR